MSNTEINYGRVILDGIKCGFATYEEPDTGAEIKIISRPYKPLQVLSNNKSILCSRTHVMIWTMVAGWLGAAELAAINEVSKSV